MPIPRILKEAFWKFPLLSEQEKEKVYYSIKAAVRSEKVSVNQFERTDVLEKYVQQILGSPIFQDIHFKNITSTPYKRQPGDSKIIAYYLSQMHPTPENDAWWGKGVTEWNNVSRAVPQFVDHYQPRLPGELGFYDLRLKENLVRQMELAQMYGIYAFNWYYYWFDGKRLLQRPLDMYLHSADIQFPFCLCWANESWTKAFFGSSKEVIMKQSNTVESYRQFIVDIADYLKDKRYVEINGKKLLTIYKPQDVPDCKNTLQYWRDYCEKHDVGELYIVGCWTSDQSDDFIAKGFDAISEFQPGAILGYCDNINKKLPFVNENFSGAVYSYKEIVENKIYRKNFSKKKMYHSVMPMWDNTPRRNNRGNLIYHGSTPELYQSWLEDVITFNKDSDLDDNLIFINAWNEWGEGAYLEPDKRYGYAYLDATLNALSFFRRKERR